MLHPSYADLMKLANSEVADGDTPVVNSRYSIVLATAKRARQIIDGAEPLIDINCPNPLSIAVDELDNSRIKILTSEEANALEEELSKKDEIEAKKAALDAEIKAKTSADGSMDVKTKKDSENVFNTED